MNIGILLGSLNGAGAEKTLLTLAEEFFQLDHNVYLFTLSPHADYSIDGDIEHCILNGKTSKLLKKDLAIQSKQRQLDLFITSKPNFYNHGVAKRKLCSVHITPTAWLVDSNKQPIKRFFQILRLKKRYQGKQLVALSHGIHDDLVNNLGCQSQNISVIPNPYKIDEIRRASLESGPLPDAPYIIYVAALIPRKRQSDLIKAFANLSNSKVKLVLVGKGQDEARLRKLVQTEGVSERVIFWGWDINPYRLIKNAKVSVLVSEAEGLPRVLVESLIIGTPVVSTDCPSGPSEVLTGDLSEYLIPVGNIDKLTRVIDHFLELRGDEIKFDSTKYSSRFVANLYLNIL